MFFISSVFLFFFSKKHHFHVFIVFFSVVAGCVWSGCALGSVCLLLLDRPLQSLPLLGRFCFFSFVSFFIFHFSFFIFFLKIMIMIIFIFDIFHVFEICVLFVSSMFQEMLFMFSRFPILLSFFHLLDVHNFLSVSAAMRNDLDEMMSVQDALFMFCRETIVCRQCGIRQKICPHDQSQFQITQERAEPTNANLRQSLDLIRNWCTTSNSRSIIL